MIEKENNNFLGIKINLQILVLFLIGCVLISIFVSIITFDTLIKEQTQKTVYDYCDQNKNCTDACFWWHYQELERINRESKYYPFVANKKLS